MGYFASEYKTAMDRHNAAKQPHFTMPAPNGPGINEAGIRHRIRCTRFSQAEIDSVLYFDSED